jgi:hypothetical protein
MRLDKVARHDRVAVELEQPLAGLGLRSREVVGPSAAEEK